MALNEAYFARRYTRQLDQAIMKQLSTKSAKPKQAQAPGPQQRQPAKGRDKSKRTPSSSPALGP